VLLAEDEQVIEALAPDRADETFRERVLPRALRRRENLFDGHALYAAPKWLTVDAIAVADEIGRCRLVREGLDDLLSGPLGGGVLSDIEVQNPPAVVGKDDQDEEDPKAGRGYGEEVDRDQVADVVGEERPPGLRGSGAPLGHEAGDRALGDVDAELEELTMDARGTPQGIRRGHCPHKRGDLVTDARTTSGRPTRELAPVLAEAATLPSEDGIR